MGPGIQDALIYRNTESRFAGDGAGEVGHGRQTQRDSSLATGLLKRLPCLEPGSAGSLGLGDLLPRIRQERGSILLLDHSPWTPSLQPTLSSPSTYWAKKSPEELSGRSPQPRS